MLLAAVSLATLPTPAAAQQAGPEPEEQVWKQQLAEEFTQVAEALTRADAVCLAVNLNNERIVSISDAEQFLPASLMKIVVASAALEVMTPDAVYTTRVVVDAGALAEVSDGVLRGDVYLVGSGDPVLSEPRYVSHYDPPVAYTNITLLADEVFDGLASAGVTRIEGRIFGDESHFDDAERDYASHFSPGSSDPVWSSSYVTTNLAGPLSGLQVNGGYSSFVAAFGSWARRNRQRAEQPAQQAASLFDDLLEARGMVITGRPKSGHAPGNGLVQLASIESPPLVEILGRMLRRSDNTIAEMILKEVGRRTRGSARADAAEGAHAIITDLLGPLADEIVIADGSGLSYLNSASCGAIADLLTLAGPDSHLAESLAVPGGPGTLGGCWASPPETGRNAVAAKTGSLNDISALAGTTQAANGDVVSFAMIVHQDWIIGRDTCSLYRRGLIDAAAHYNYGPPGGTPPLSASVTDNEAEESDPDTVSVTQGACVFDGVADTTIPKVIDLGGSVHSLSVEQVVRARIMDTSDASTGRFCPNEPVTRAQMASILARALGLWPGPPGSFDDARGSVHESAISAIAAAGITRGCATGPPRFCPDRLVTRAQMASLIVRALALEPGPPGRFDDARGSVHESAISAIAAAGITRGCATGPPRFCPDRLVTRAQMASLIVRALNLDPR